MINAVIFRLIASRKLSYEELVPKFFLKLTESKWDKIPMRLYKNRDKIHGLGIEKTSFLQGKYPGYYKLNPGGWWEAIAGESLEMAALAALNVANAVVENHDTRYVRTKL